MGGHVDRPDWNRLYQVEFPAGDHEDLVAAWLWSDLAGVVRPPQHVVLQHGA